MLPTTLLPFLPEMRPQHHEREHHYQDPVYLCDSPIQALRDNDEFAEEAAMLEVEIGGLDFHLFGFAMTFDVEGDFVVGFCCCRDGIITIWTLGMSDLMSFVICQFAG